MSIAREEPRRLGDFEILRELGRGGMGVVYEARQASLNRKVALKVLSTAAGLTTPKAVQRFQREAEAAAKLHHTNIVPVHAVGCERGVHFYAMQFIEAPTLAELIAALQQDKRSPDHNAPGSASAAPSTREIASSGTTLSDGSSLSSLSAEHARQSSTWFRLVARLVEPTFQDARPHHRHRPCLPRRRARRGLRDVPRLGGGPA